MHAQLTCPQTHMPCTHTCWRPLLSARAAVSLTPPPASRRVSVAPAGPLITISSPSRGVPGTGGGAGWPSSWFLLPHTDSSVPQGPILPQLQAPLACSLFQKNLRPPPPHDILFIQQTFTGAASRLGTKTSRSRAQPPDLRKLPGLWGDRHGYGGGRHQGHRAGGGISESSRGRARVCPVGVSAGYDQGRARALPARASGSVGRLGGGGHRSGGCPLPLGQGSSLAHSQGPPGRE